MRLGLSLVAVPLLAAGFAPCARAQTSLTSQGTLYDVAGPYAIISPGLTYRQPATGNLRSSTSLRLQTSVIVPDRGEALLGGYSSAREGRNAFGAPVLGKMPTVPGFRNAGSSRTVRSTTASVRVRIIRMAEEEERQTGVRSH